MPEALTWVHKDGTTCPDWETCDTYEHTRSDGNEVIQRIKAEPVEAERHYHQHWMDEPCTETCESFGVDPKHGTHGHQLPSDPTPAPPQTCVQCSHEFGDHDRDPEGNGCRLCKCPRYNDTEGVGVTDERGKPLPPSNEHTLIESEQPSPFDEAMSLVAEVIDGRVDVYGDPAKVFVRHAQIWSGILGIEVQPWQVALCMIGYKLGRTAITPDYSDNSDDIEGYLDIFRTILGEDMVHARDTKAYIAGGGQGVRT